MQPPELKFFCEIIADLGKPIEKGSRGAGRLRIIPILGGTVTGERLSGRVLNLGADWQVILNDGHAELDTRYAIETHDGAFIDIRNFGYRHGPAEVMAKLASGQDVDPSLYYMRTNPRFETGDPRYAFLNRTMFVGVGERRANAALIRVFEVV